MSLISPILEENQRPQPAISSIHAQITTPKSQPVARGDAANLRGEQQLPQVFRLPQGPSERMMVKSVEVNQIDLATPIDNRATKSAARNKEVRQIKVLMKTAAVV